MGRDIREWLEGLGLGRYSDVFSDNEIELDALPLIAEDDLKEIGVALGARRKILAAIAELGHSDKNLTADKATNPQAIDVGAERRQLTVVFVDLVGSTALSTKLDPEDLREVMRRYQDAVAGSVSRYGGYIARYLGDGILIYFGWPQAHEDDAERAVRAAIEAVAATANLDCGEEISLQARAGIATGHVVVGDLIGEMSRDSMAVSGATPNLAARLQEVAGAGEVLISLATRRLIGNAFELANIGSQVLKGFDQPAPVWRVIRERPSESRFKAARGSLLTDFVGRDEEVDLLLRRWEQAKAREGQVLVLCGEAGIGKSRIVQKFSELHIARSDHTILRYQCSPYHMGTAFYPFVSQLERAAGFLPDDSPEVKLDKLEALLAIADDAILDVAPLFAALLSVSHNGRYHTRELTPQQQKEQTFDALIGQLLGLAEQEPVLVIFEDIHWIDPSSLEVLTQAFERVQRAPVFIVITHRPEYQPTWQGQPNLTSLTLNRLSRGQSLSMVANVAGGENLPERVVDNIVAKAEGIPLFVEELTKAVLELGGLASSSDKSENSEPLSHLAIPSTLQDSLMARLDRLGQTKEVAQTGAAIGREFRYSLLLAITGNNDEIDEELRQLVSAELVYRRGGDPDVTYVFKHALVRDAAYDSMLLSRRQKLHARIARAYEEQFPALCETEPEVVAHHLSAACERSRAITYWHKAGLLAVQRSANAEAVGHFQRALDLVGEQQESQDRDSIELDLRINLGPVLMAAKGYATEEVENCYTRARELAEKLQDSERLFTVLYGLWQSRNIFGRTRVAKDIADELVSMTQRDGDAGRRLQAHHANWTSALCIGDPQGARDHACSGLDIYNPEQHRDHRFLYGAHDPAACGLGVNAVACWMLGKFDDVERLSRKSLAIAESLKHPGSAAVAHMFATIANFLSGNFEQAIKIGKAGTELCEDSGLLTWGQITGVVEARALAILGGEDEAVGFQRCLENYRATGHGVFWPWFLLLDAEAKLEAGDICNAALELERALTHSRESGEAWFDAELHRRKGELFLARSADATAEAEASFITAKGIAQAQKARVFELRAATSLARLLIDQTRFEDARKALEPAYAYFAESADTTETDNAKALLDELP